MKRKLIAVMVAAQMLVTLCPAGTVMAAEAELYDEGYVAKRMEIGAVIGASPKENVIREVPQNEDIIILLGGRTGRDGCGGATGSSKAHDSHSIETCGAEVQKGNPPTERKIQRLFRNPEVAKMIKRCNDFGAGGVSVATTLSSIALGVAQQKNTVKNVRLRPACYEYITIIYCGVIMAMCLSISRILSCHILHLR